MLTALLLADLIHKAIHDAEDFLEQSKISADKAKQKLQEASVKVLAVCLRVLFCVCVFVCVCVCVCACYH